MVEDVAFSPDGKTLAMASREGNVQLWDVATGKLLETLKGHSSAVRAVVFSPDGRTLASGSSDQTVRLWNVETRRELMQLDPGSVELGQVQTLAFSPDGKQLLAGGRRRRLLVHRADRLERSRPGRRKTATAAAIERRLPEPHPDVVREPRLHETLEKLEKLAPNDVRVQAALAVTRARRFAAQGNATFGGRGPDKARALLEGMLAKEPENSVWAVELAQLLLGHARKSQGHRWTVLKPVEAKSKLGADLVDSS